MSGENFFGEFNNLLLFVMVYMYGFVIGVLNNEVIYISFCKLCNMSFDCLKIKVFFFIEECDSRYVDVLRWDSYFGRFFEE